MEAEVHITGLLILAAPGHAAEVAAALARLPGTEVDAVGEAGKLVVVCECASGDQTLALMARMRELPGVVDAALVYQHAESAAAMQEEICDEDDAP